MIEGKYYERVLEIEQWKIQNAVSYITRKIQPNRKYCLVLSEEEVSELIGILHGELKLGNEST